ncbi:amino acid adenylation domain-containing protein [Pseudomonas sp. 14P_8.1_Bac3]|uniref:amino acid adenylation domain-containing protein n=1 Tax=Pseudomonas sp. 14P_8.1_Bac3 TaxID=2971621 RepID=UPI0021C956A4|nr:non-ribosomal peptide synthetase [Pseudomonas sp. 14P_8.1_Bac3]MCU1758985.1 amino acid adenylation domain-containing protein [Pseudomonas sp. 14P_8.1_Bac3]
MNDLIDDDLLALLLAEAGDQPHGIAARAQQSPAPLSFAQQRLWFLQQLSPDSAAYNLPRVLRITGKLPAQRLENALNTVLGRHDVLRSAFREIDGVAMQVVDDQARLVLGEEDLSGLEDEARSRLITQRIEAQAGTPFDLRQAPLMRATLLKLGADGHLLLMDMHHIVSDAWSNAILLQDLTQAFAQEDTTPLPRPAIQYADYATWQRGEYLNSPTCDNSADYWQTYLGKPLPTLDMPVDFPRSEQHRHPAGQHDFRLPASLCATLNRFCQDQGLTPFVVALGAWQLLLSRYSGQQDFTVGVPNATRNRSETQELVGYFVSSQVYRVRIDPLLSGSAFLQRLRRESLAALDHGEYPLELSFDALQLQASAQPNPLFQVLFNWRADAGEPERIDLPGLTLEFLDTGTSQAKFDLSLDVTYSPQGIEASVEYSRDLYAAATIERLARHWQNLLQALIDDPSRALGELSLLDAAERQLQLRQWNPPVSASPEDGVHQLFERQTLATPHAVALICNDLELSYGQLNAAANHLAHILIEQGVGPEVLVGIAVERSASMIISLLAVLKAGGAYVPLDPDYPQDRLTWMIEDSGLSVLLSQRSLLDRLPSLPGVRIRCVDDIDVRGSSDAGNPACRTTGLNLAYVMFTSGSTGRPKGVGITQAALTRHAQVALEFLGLTAKDRSLQFATFNFDAFVEQLYPALICGASVVLRGPDIWDSATWYRELLDKQFTTSDLTTTYWNMLAKDFAAAGLRDYGALRQVIVGGEAMPPQGVAAWGQAGLGHVKLLNTYGPTETTVSATLLDCSDYVTGRVALPKSMPIGQPLAGRAIYLLDNGGQPVPVGVVGELVIAGDLLARGYFKRPDLTAERFMPNPFDTQGGGRLYRTGDLARYRADGVIEYVGRLDHQVKIRGFRIELGEIESCLLQSPSVREALVVAREGSAGMQLVGYVVARGDGLTEQQQLDLRETLKAQLRASLPGYMVPAHVLVLAAMPLSPNGKLDRKALPLPDLNQAQRPFIAPETPLEQGLAQLWQEALQVERVSLDDNFFEVGGHSILAIQFISALHARLGIKLALQHMLAHPTIEALARFIALEHQQNTQCVVELNASAASAPPLFCLHPSGGIVFCYQPLAKKLSPHAQTFGVMHKGFADKDSNPQSWAEMIADYSAQIIDKQPYGPYRLMGWSLGGAIAMDVAAHLERQGREVSFLGLVDTTLPDRDLPADLPRKPLEEDNPNHLSPESELLAALEVFSLMFAHLEEAASAFVAEHPDTDLKAFYRWACEQTSTGEQEMIATLQGIKQEIMNAQAHAIHDRLVDAFEAFSLPMLKVRASCWWSLSHKTLEQVRYSEQLLQAHNVTGQLQTSIHSPLPHRSMIYNESLLASFSEVFLHCERQQRH